MESGRSSRPPRRRRSGRRPSSSSNFSAGNSSSGNSSSGKSSSGNNGRSNGSNGQSKASDFDLYRLPPGHSAESRTNGSSSLARRRSLRSPRPDSQFNLRRLLDEPNSRNGNASRRRPADDPGASLARLRPIQPAPISKVGPNPKDVIIPIQARPVRSPASEPTLPNTPTPRRRRRRTQKPPTPLLYITRLLIFGVGVGAIVGTILSIWTPTHSPFTGASTAANPASANAEERPADAETNLFRLDSAPPSVAIAPLGTRLKQPINELATAIQPLVAQAPDVKPSIFIVDLDSGNYVDINGDIPVPAASTIKVPILVAYLQDVDGRKARLDEPITMEPVDITGGAGDLQFLEPGTPFSSLDTITRMITVSDNTATNMVIRRVGGLEVMNQRFQQWGMTHTVMRNLLADLEGTNTTSARDLSLLLMAVTQGDLLSLRSRDRLIDIMRGTVTDTLIPAGSGPDALVAHKTGTINPMVGDTGIVDMPNGKRYVLTVLVQRTSDDGRAQELARQVARVTYDYFSKVPAPASANPPATTAPVQ